MRLVSGDFQSVAGSLSCDSVVLIFVLEHIKDDESLLRTIHQTLRLEGTLLLYVPALSALYESLDEIFWHVRRNRTTELNSLLSKCAFQLVGLRYLNFPGVVTWFFAGRIVNRKSLDPSNA